MIDISTKYLGLDLRNPVIVGSSGLTDSAEKIQEIEAAGAGAVVLKSIFEEEIAFEYEDILNEASGLTSVDLDQFDYYDLHIRRIKLSNYIDLIKDAKKKVQIPVIASINCVYSHEWTAFAKEIQKAGADALELNMFFLPSDLKTDSSEQERRYFKIVDEIVRRADIPVSLKISYYFSCLGRMIEQLSRTGISGIVLFNRFFNPDIDIATLKVKPSFKFSSPADIAQPLRWVGMMSQRVDCDLAASTGVHDGEGVIKQLLAGAKAVQMVSALYKNKVSYIEQVTDTLRLWMQEHGFESLQEFAGRLSQDQTSDPAVYDRLQFMKYYS